MGRILDEIMKVYHVYPMDIDHGELSKKSSDKLYRKIFGIVEVDATFHYDVLTVSDLYEEIRNKNSDRLVIPLLFQQSNGMYRMRILYKYELVESLKYELYDRIKEGYGSEDSYTFLIDRYAE